LPDFLDTSRIVNGHFAYVYMDGAWQTNVTACTADVEPDYKEVLVCGTRWTQHKLGSIKGTGSITGFKVTSDMIQLNLPITNDRRGAVTTELITKLDDPEAYGHERIRLKNINFTKIPLVGWKVGDLIEEEWPYVFHGVELLDPIEAD